MKIIHVLMAVPALCGLWANLPMATGLVCGDNSSSFPMPMPLDDNGMPMCALGFNCPSFNPSDPSTYPQFCAPTPQCIVGRAFGERCPRQSAQEPEVCHGGYYCPTATDVFICPEGHYCPPAAYKPIKCPPLSFCPEGSDHLVYFGGVAASLCLLLALVIMLVLYRKHWRYSQLAVIAGKGERFVDAVSPKSMRKRRKSTESNTGLRRYPTMVFDQAPPENHVSAFFTASTHSHNALDLPPPTAPVVISDEKDIEGTPINKNITLANADTVKISNRQRAIDVLAGGFLLARSSKALSYEVRDLKVFAPVPAPRVTAAQLLNNRPTQEEPNKNKNAVPQIVSTSVEEKFQGIPILRGVTATFEPSRVTAIIGPGGCGKSTLLNALLDRLPRGWKRAGYVAVNGDSSPDVIRRLRYVTGYAAQTEALHRELTVYQNLLYSSAIRLPRHWSNEDRECLLAATLEALQLGNQKDMMIGDEETRGISGGQRRRCHIGIELASAPYALFLDEPTNGLDSTTALEVCNCLGAIAAGADLTVVMTMSQPRVEIWNQLHDIIVMGKRGRVVYQGKRKDATKFFTEHYGVVFSTNGNPADIIVDAVADRSNELADLWEKHTVKTNDITMNVIEPPGTYSPKELPHDDVSSPLEIEHIELDPEAPPHVFSPHERAPNPLVVPAANTRSLPVVSLLDSLTVNAQHVDSVGTFEEPPHLIVSTSGGSNSYQGATFLRQFAIIFKRSVAKQLSDIQPLIVEQIINIAIASVLGLTFRTYKAYWEFIHFKLVSPPSNFLLPQVFMYLSMSLGIVCVMPGGGVFVNDRLTYFREVTSGFNKAAYYLGSVAASQPRIILTSIIFTTIFQLIPRVAVDFGELFLAVWLMAMCSYALGGIPAMYFSPSTSPLVSSLLIILFGCLSGFIDFPIGLKYISYSFWTASILQRNFQRPVAHAYKDLSEEYGWISDDIGFCVGMVFVVLVVLHLIAYSCMVLLNRDKQR